MFVMEASKLSFGLFLIIVMMLELTVVETTGDVTTNATGPIYRVATVLSEPWMMKTDDGFEGLLVDLLDEISNISNFSYVIKDTANNTYGRIKYIAGEIQVNGIIGDLISGEADLGVADLMITEMRSNVVSFSTPIARTGLQILLRKPEHNERGIGLMFAPFSTSLWICILVASMFTAIVIFITEQLLRPGNERQMEICRQNPVRNFQLMVSIFLPGPRETPIPFSVRIMSSTWWGFIMLILIAYVVSLSGYLASTSNIKPVIPFKTFDEMAAQSDVRYGGWPEMSLNQGDSIQQAMYRHIKSHNTHYTELPVAVKKVLDKDNVFAAIVDGLSGQKVVNKHCDLMLLQERLFEIDYAIACTRNDVGAELCQNISHAIFLLRETGTLNKIMMKWLEAPTKCEKVYETDYITASNSRSTSFKSLSIKDLFVAYIVLLIGTVLSVIATVITKTRERKSSDAQVERDDNHISSVASMDEHMHRKEIPLKIFDDQTTCKDEQSCVQVNEDYPEYPDIDDP